MHVWWTKQEEYADELEDLEEAALDAEFTASTEETANSDSAGGDSTAEEAGAAAEAKAPEKKDPTAEERLEKAQREAVAALSKEKSARWVFRSFSSVTEDVFVGTYDVAFDGFK